MSPELISGEGYGCSTDIWALGIMIYEMLVGTTPFYNPEGTSEDMYKRITDPKEEIPFPEDFKELQAKDLIKQILVRDPSRRLGVKSRRGYKSIREHSWLSGMDWNGILAQKAFPPFTPPHSKDSLNFVPSKTAVDAAAVAADDVFTGDNTLFEGW